MSDAGYSTQIEGLTRGPFHLPPRICTGAPGCEEGIERNTDSLNYLADPVPGLWLPGPDSCQYDPEGASGRTGGSFSRDNLDWIPDILAAAARKQNQAVLAMRKSVQIDISENGRLSNGLIATMP